jgi:DASS family divalent anion:Na+ symporter
MELIKQNKRGFQFILILLIGLIIWLIPRPESIDPQGWRLLCIFIATIAGIVLKPLPMGAIALFSLTITILTNTLTFSEAFAGFSKDIVWLVVSAFFIARGFIISGLGTRIAYFFMSLFGKTTLGLGYSLAATEFLIAPFIPSLTARSGGVVFPVLKSLSEAFGSNPNDSSSLKMGSFLTLCAFQAAVITSAMFYTAMAGNPLIAEIGTQVGVDLNLGLWALAMIVPGLVSLLVMPYVIYKIAPPKVKNNPKAKEYSQEQLKILGKLKPKEWVMFAVFILLIVLWIFGKYIGITATLAAFIGLVILLVTGILDWKDLTQEGGAWDTLIWFSTLITLGAALNQFGITTWFSSLVVAQVGGLNWILAFGILALVYFYSHYFFASNVAHIGAMLSPFLLIAVALGTPPMLAALILAAFSNLFGGLTHYGCGPAPILFGSGFVKMTTWWRVGFIMSVVNIILWTIVGCLWWKLLGLW